MRALERTMNPMEAEVQVISYRGMKNTSVLWRSRYLCTIFVSHRPLKVCVQKCRGHAWREPGLFTCFNLIIFLILSQMLAVGICRVLHFYPSFWTSCLLENNVEPCKGNCLWHYDQRLKQCVTFIFRDVQEMEIDLLVRQRAAGNVLVVFNVP